MSNPSVRRVSSLLIALVATVAVACSDATTSPGSTITAGLSEVGANDTTGWQPATTDGPGFFHGTVIGPSTSGIGTDTIATAPRIAGVTVTIYPGAPTSTGGVSGTAVGSTTTDQAGLWTLPTLPAGEYTVTFVPPDNSPYRGVYAFGPLHFNSGNYPWWVVLPKK